MYTMGVSKLVTIHNVFTHVLYFKLQKEDANSGVEIISKSCCQFKEFGTEKYCMEEGIKGLEPDVTFQALGQQRNR